MSQLSLRGGGHKGRVLRLGRMQVSLLSLGSARRMNWQLQAIQPSLDF